MKEILQKSKDLKGEASYLLYKKGMHDLLQSRGEVLYAGSFVLDLMIWKDIDLNIIVEQGERDSVAKKIVCDLLDREDVSRVKVFRDLRKRHGTAMPDSIYVGAQIGDWKFDIHIVYADQAEETNKKTEQVLSLLNQGSREKILYWKSKLLTESGRMPKFSSYHLYNAILIHGLDQDEDILDYLRQQKVSV